MQTFIKITILYHLLILTELNASNIIRISDTVVTYNQLFSLEISLANSDSVIGYQFDVKIPEEVEYQDSFRVSNRYIDHQVIVNEIDATTLRALCFSPTNSALNDTTGSLLKLIFRSKDISGQFPVTLNNAILVGTKNNNVLDSVRNGNITITSPTKLNSIHQDNLNPEIQVYPNPFNGMATIKYFTNQIKPVEIFLFNLLGEKISEKIILPEKMGWNIAVIRPENLSSGLYFLRLLIEEKIYLAKLIYTR